MQKATSVTHALEILLRDGEVHLDAYFITSHLLTVELQNLGIDYRKQTIDKWNHIFTKIEE